MKLSLLSKEELECAQKLHDGKEVENIEHYVHKAKESECGLLFKLIKTFFQQPFESNFRYEECSWKNILLVLMKERTENANFPFIFYEKKDDDKFLSIERLKL